MRALPLAFVLLATAAWAQDIDTQLTGRLDSSFTWLAEGNQSVGMVGGWAGLTGGTKDVKTEIRTTFANVPEPALGLARAWVKFRFPAVRFTTGLGRLAWGTGFVLVPGDLLFDPGTELDFESDELRSRGEWLGDLWLSLGDEAFAEAAVLKDALGARLSASLAGATVEGAAAWNRGAKAASAALSTQFHVGGDWYATLRQDLATDHPALSLDHLVTAAGFFGLWQPAEGLRFSTRHEAQVSGNDSLDHLRSYHDLSLTLDGGWSVTGRLLTDKLFSRDRTWSPSAEIRWSPLQNLSLYSVATLNGPWVLKAGVTSKW